MLILDEVLYAANRGLVDPGDVISLGDTQLVKGSHGRPTDDPADGPLVISSEPDLLPEGEVDATAFKDLVLAHVFTRVRAGACASTTGAGPGG